MFSKMLKLLVTAVPVLVLAVAPLCPQVTNKATKEESWVVLFDGKSTDQWRGYKSDRFPAKGWVIDDGCLHIVKGQGGGDIVTRNRFADFELELDWKVAPGGNSGIMYRVVESEDAPYKTGPEYQLLDDERHDDGKDPLTSAASLYALVAPTKKVVRPAGQFNQTRIVLRGTKVEHWLNGVKVVDADLASPEIRNKIAKSKFNAWKGFAMAKTGYIDLQDHGNDVWFCKIRIRELK